MNDNKTTETKVIEYLNIDIFLKILYKNSRCILDTQCIEWIGTLTAGTGYGVFHRKGKRYLVHRLSYELYNQKKIEPRKYILHSCNNRRCLNPNHLKEGSHLYLKEKIQIKKGVAVGERVAQSKLTKKQVLEIINLLTLEKSCKDISKIYDVHAHCINDIKLGKTWKWLTKINRNNILANKLKYSSVCFYCNKDELYFKALIKNKIILKCKFCNKDCSFLFNNL